MKDLEYPGYAEQKKIDYLAVSEDDLNDLAAADTERAIAEKKSALDENYYDKAEKAQKKLEKAENEKTEAIKTASENFSTGAENLRRKYLKNGMARSTVAEKQGELLEENYKNELSSALSAANKSVKSIESEIETLNADYNRAVESLNVGKSVAIKQRINELKAEQAKKIQEIEKYNAAIDENKRMYDEAKEKHDAKNAEKKNEIKRELVVNVINKLRALSESEAEELLNDEDVQAALGEDLSYIRRTLKTFK